MRRLRLASLAVCLALSAGALLLSHSPGVSAASEPFRVAGAPISVGPNVRVSAAFPNWAHDEVIVAADPSNPNNLIGCTDMAHTAVNGGPSETVVYSSFDGGMHWSPTLRASFGLSAGDPACAFGRGGHAYYAVLGLKNGAGITTVYSSYDAGRTWPHQVRLPVMDREYVTVDTTRSRFAGRVYVNATRGTQPIDADGGIGDFTNGISIYHSLDKGATFEQGVTLSDTHSRYVLGMGDGTVLSDGTFIALFGDLKNTATGWNYIPKTSTAWLKVVTSHDGGERFAPASIVDNWYYCNISKDGDVPSIASDLSTGPFHNRIYATWDDIRSGRCQIMMAFSDDKGKTWSPATVVSDDFSRADGNGPDDFMPVIAVNKRGVVGIAWYDRRDSPDNIGYLVRFSASYDGGRSWLASVPVSEASSELFTKARMQVADVKYAGTAQGVSARVGPGSFQFSGGHTAGLAASADGAFHPFWVDNRTGIHQVWTAAVNVSGQAYRNGSAALASMRDVSSMITLNLHNVVFDSAAGTVTADASLSNTSKKNIAGPIYTRVLTLSSDFGVLSVDDSANGITKAGALLNFSDVLSGNRLPAGSSTGVKHLTFHLADLRAYHASNDNAGPSSTSSNFVNMQRQVLASATKDS